MNPVLIFEIPIHRQLVSEDAVREIIPEMMDLFVAETASFFRDHMPEIHAQDFFARLLSDADVNGGRQWAFAAGKGSGLPSLHSEKAKNSGGCFLGVEGVRINGIFPA